MRDPALRRRAAFVTGAASAFAGIGIARPARGAQFAWKFGFSLASNHPLNVRMVEAFGKIKRETNGDVVVTSYPNSSLGGYGSMVTQHRLGALEMMANNGASIDNIVPNVGIDELAFVFGDSKQAFTAMDGDLGAYVRREMLAHGIFAFERCMEQGYRHFTSSNRPIDTADDVQGLKLRVAQGKLFFDTFRSLGASVVTVDSGSIYTALQTHLVDAQETPLLFIEVERYFEVQKYCSLSHHMWTSYWITVNQAKWDSLPKRYQEIMSKHIDAAALLERRDAEILDSTLRDKLQRQGLIFNNPDVASLKAKLVSAGYYNRWRDQYGPAAWAALTKYTGSFG